MDIGAGIAGISSAIQLGKTVAKAATELEKADLKLRLVELVDALVDAKNALVTAQQENNELREQIKRLEESQVFRQELVEWQGHLYRKDADGNRVGRPFCPRCLEVDGKYITLHIPPGRADWYMICPNCKNDYVVDRQAEAREADARRQEILALNTGYF